MIDYGVPRAMPSLCSSSDIISIRHVVKVCEKGKTMPARKSTRTWRGSKQCRWEQERKKTREARKTTLNSPFANTRGCMFEGMSITTISLERRIMKITCERENAATIMNKCVAAFIIKSRPRVFIIHMYKYLLKYIFLKDFTYFLFISREGWDNLF